MPRGRMTASIAVEEALLILKILFLVLLYLFIWRIVRSATRDLRLPQESFVLGPEAAAALRGEALKKGSDFVLDSAPLTVGRGAANDLELRGDDFASAEHARFEPRRDGVWLSDVGSTNGTFVNGVRLERPRKLSPGDRIRIGATDLRFDT